MYSYIPSRLRLSLTPQGHHRAEAPVLYISLLLVAYFTHSRVYIPHSPQLNWVFLIAQLVKNPPAMQETLVRFLSQEDPLEKGYAIHSSILGLPLWLSW